MCLLEQKLPQGSYRGAPKHLSGSADMLSVQDAALAANDGVVVDRRMLAYADLAPDQAVRPDR